jgi:L-lactate dehydrogenase (cytochrome)
MLGTKRRSFGNIVGHVKGVGDMGRWRPGRPSSSTRAELGRRGVDQEALGRQADPQGHHGRGRRAPGGGQRRRCAHRQQPRRPPARRRAFSIAALPAIVEAVGKHIEVWMDGGIRSGQDVLKAWALGARGT